MPDTPETAERSPCSSASLEVQGLEVVYNRTSRVLHGISLQVRQQSIVALLGPNGSGKTTLLRAISGLLAIHDGQIRKGRILIDNRDVTGAPAPRMVRQGLAQTLERRQLFPALTVEENLVTGAHTRRKDRAGVRKDLDAVYSRFPTLHHRRRERAGHLSGGEQQMLAIGRALMARPRLLLLDEPTLGLAPQLIDQTQEIIESIRQAGTAVLIVEQNAQMALGIANHGYVMEAGRVVMDDNAAKLQANDDIREFYLGLRTHDRASYRHVKRYRRKKRWLS